MIQICSYIVLIISISFNQAYLLQNKKYILSRFLSEIQSFQKLQKSILIISIASISFQYPLDNEFLIPKSAYAFENAVIIVKIPKIHGSDPTNIGLDQSGRLQACFKPSPNCFSTSEDIKTIEMGYTDEHHIPLWKYEGKDVNKAYDLIGEVLQSYKPGQNNIDGGGFKIITADRKKHYYYIQYESLKRGFRDDVEITVNNDCSIQVRSSSRLGYLDYTVNAKRLNYIANQLTKKGFVAPQITEQTNPGYFQENRQVES